jgi:hypothetical protein
MQVPSLSNEEGASSLSLILIVTLILRQRVCPALLLAVRSQPVEFTHSGAAVSTDEPFCTQIGSTLESVMLLMQYTAL